MSERTKYPAPTGRDWQEWAGRLIASLERNNAADARFRAAPVLLQRIIGTPPATTNGLLLWDEVNKCIVVSVDGQWKKVEFKP